ncbi:MAG: histidine kinase [Thiolinea sp.]
MAEDNQQPNPIPKSRLSVKEHRADSLVSQRLDAAIQQCLLGLIHSPEAADSLQQLTDELCEVLSAESCLLLDAGETQARSEYAGWLQALEHGAENTAYFALDVEQCQLIFPLRFERRLCGGLVVRWKKCRDYQIGMLTAVSRVCPVLAQMLLNIAQARNQRRHDLYEERATISRELHDSLAQSLTYLKIQAARLDAALKKTPQLQSKQAAQDILAELRSNLNDAYRQLRSLMTTFRLTMHGKSFKLAVHDSIDEFNKYNNMVFELNDRCPAGILTVEEEMQVLQIIREALYNIVKHSQAKLASVALHFEKPLLVVAIRDDGIGFDRQQKYDRHHGLTIMQERTYHLGGKLKVRAVDPAGTEIRISFAPKSCDNDKGGRPYVAASN